MALSMTAWAQNFASLTVIPLGAQRYDLATGVTDLPGGGEIREGDSGISLLGRSLRFAEGRFIEAQGAVIVGRFGDLEAASARFDLPLQTLQLTDNVRFAGPFIMQAESMRVDLRADLIVAQGGVSINSPALTGTALLLEVTRQEAYLHGPYTFEGEAGDAWQGLVIRWTGEPGAYNFTTHEPDDYWLARAAQHLP